MTRWTPEAKQKLREAMLGENNSQWKGEIGLSALHWWVRQHLPKPDKCQMCFEGPAYDLANVTGIYKRDLYNWKYLCRRCHMTFDGRLLARQKWQIRITQAHQSLLTIAQETQIQRLAQHFPICPGEIKLK